MPHSSTSNINFLDSFLKDAISLKKKSKFWGESACHVLPLKASSIHTLPIWKHQIWTYVLSRDKQNKASMRPDEMSSM